MPTDSIKVICKRCNGSSSYTKDALTAEISRLKIYNYEILTCSHCQQKFSKEDFEKALGILSEKEKIEIAKTQEEESLQLKLKMEIIKQEEIKKMENGEKYDEKITGPIEMEKGSPGDKRCVAFLRTEGEIYGYAYIVGRYGFNIINYIFTGIISVIVAISVFIWELIEKINWCIACSIARISYFIAYVGLVGYGFVATFILNEGILNDYYVSFVSSSTTTSLIDGSQTTLPPSIWNAGIILVFTIPLLFQLAWAFEPSDSRWAKVIKKSAERITKK